MAMFAMIMLATILGTMLLFLPTLWLVSFLLGRLHRHPEVKQAVLLSLLIAFMASLIVTPIALGVMLIWAEKEYGPDRAADSSAQTVDVEHGE